MTSAPHMQRPVVHLLVGLPGSGKSTYARSMERAGLIRLSVDEALQERHGVLGEDYSEDQHLSLLAPVVGEVREQLIAAVRAGHSVVLDHGLGKRDEREDFKQLVEGLGATWRLLHFTTDRAELLRRLAARSAGQGLVPVDAATLDWMAAVTEEPHDEGQEMIDTTVRLV